MNGILNVLKPPGMTSFDVVAALRGLLHIKKIGHTGTLDPGVAGVLPICIGSATKTIEHLTEKTKKYRAELRLGITTDTQDATGRITGERKINITEEDIKNVMQAFEGKQKQIPPMYSAVSIGGVRLYKLARNGIEVERPARDIEIYNIDIINIKNCSKVLFDVKCSKGTYIRTLCADIGDKLGCGGHMSFLIRVEAGIFNLRNAFTLEQIYQMAETKTLDSILMKPDEIFDEYREIRLPKIDEKRIINGSFVDAEQLETIQGEFFRVYDLEGQFLAIAEAVKNEGRLMLKSKKLFI